VGRRRLAGRVARLSLGLEKLNTRNPLTLSTSPDFWRGELVRREDLLKPDVMSEIILLGFGVLIFAILLLVLIAAWTQAPGLV
jgi:hypothetical protein